MGECEVVLGIDACPGGWVAVELRDGLFAGASIATGLRSLLQRPGADPGGVVAVDMPLGLLDTGWRRAGRGCGRRARPDEGQCLPGAAARGLAGGAVRGREPPLS
ncbi:DUF429 domain-containing protein [Streptomyces sp. NBC_00259]|uniref:DUF429 domain-containing protein n=1 Tax=Streptomyces sp. NBC_00259 TaxID=2903643 RepID=UPI002E27BA71|nr:DUF429 domain-containing protein [Streptomyces sp. NBC_00259]